MPNFAPDQYKEILLFLGTAGLVAPLFRHLKLSPILGYLGAGILVGPYGLGLFAKKFVWASWASSFAIDNLSDVALFGEFGVVFLLFMIGLELSWERLARLRRLVFGFGLMQIFSCAAVLGACGVKNMFVVDPDIDIFNDEEMEWALGTRFQPAKDLIIVDNVRMSPLDPSLDGARTGSKAGYDLTWPFGKGGMDTIIPAAPSYEGKTFASIAAALKDGPKYFEELMAAVGSRDGREIVRELAVMKAGRDPQGRWTAGA